MKTLTTQTMTHRFLDKMAPEHRDELLKNAEQVEFAPNEIIFREGDPANRFYLIECGKVVLESPSRGTVIHIQTLGANDALGWSWLFPGFAWHFQARALETTRAIACNGAHLLVHCEEDRDFGYELMKRVAQVVIQRLQATRQQLAQMANG